ncbi:MAG: hypothetical protein RMJ97_05005 [Raineya sp.]|nr:hypothetical protein [Raineya sp.]
MKKHLLTFGFLLAFQAIFAQSNDYEIATDRPTVSFSAATVPKNKLILESGYFRSTDQVPPNKLNIHFPNLFLRYGVTKRLELRLGQEVEISRYFQKNQLQSQNTFWQPMHLGVKYRISDFENEKFTMSAMWVSRIPVPSDLEKITQRHYTKLLIQYNFNEEFYTFSNLGLDLLRNFNNENELAWAYTLGIGRKVMQGLYTFVEYCGLSLFPMDNANHTHGLNMGSNYIFDNRYQFDVLYGMNLERPFREFYYFTLGFSTYLNFQKE